MPSLSDLITKGRLKRILGQYSAIFRIPVFVFHENQALLLSIPEGVREPELAAKPLFVRDLLVGHVAVPMSDPAGLDFIAENLSVILEQGYEIESLSAEVARNYEEFSLLWSLSSKLASVLDVRKVCEIAADEIMSFCPSKSVSIVLVEDISSDIISGLRQPVSPAAEGQREDCALSAKVALGEYADKALKMTLNTGKGLAGYAFRKKEAVTVCDVLADSRFEGLPYPVSRILIVPLVVEGRSIGEIVVTDKLNGEEFFSTDLKTISSIASECAVSVKKASLFSEIRSMLFSTAEAFSFAIEAKDPYTYGHSKRVSELSVRIAQGMGFGDDAVAWIRLAALLHDIGKIGVPEEILRKRDKLTPIEMEKVREHPMVGARVIECIKNLSEVAKWIYHHHEKYDGSGYPDGIAHDTIPISSRIISLADVFDALTSDRPYRKAFAVDEAAEIMKQSVGEHFDPGIFEYFEGAIRDPRSE